MYPYQINSLDDYQQAYQLSIQNPEQFWATIATNFVWEKLPAKILDWNFNEPIIQWFADGELNITVNFLDRHLEKNGNDLALIWEPNNSNDTALSLSYKDLHQRVNIFANVLKNNGIKKGDRICIYMPVVPQLTVATLACARIGAIHIVVPATLDASGLTANINDCGCSLVITADGFMQSDKLIMLKTIMDDALQNTPTVQKVIVYKRMMQEVPMQEGRDVWWMDEYEKVFNSGNLLCVPEIMNAEDPLFILYTSSSTGKPKGVVYSCGGYMVYATYTFVNLFQYQKGQVYFCTAGMGTITAHSYILYGPLCAGATTVLFEGIPAFPDTGRIWDIVKKHQVNILYTDAGVMQNLRNMAKELPEGIDLSSIAVLGVELESDKAEDWHGQEIYIGKKTIPMVLTWAQAETGACIFGHMAGILAGQTGLGILPMPGIDPVLVDEKGNEVIDKNEEGNWRGSLCLKMPWPGMIRTIFGDQESYRKNYFMTFEGLYFTGVIAMKDEKGSYRISGEGGGYIKINELLYNNAEQ